MSKNVGGSLENAIRIDGKGTKKIRTEVKKMSDPANEEAALTEERIQVT